MQFNKAITVIITITIFYHYAQTRICDILQKMSMFYMKVAKKMFFLMIFGILISKL